MERKEDGAGPDTQSSTRGRRVVTLHEMCKAAQNVSLKQRETPGARDVTGERNQVAQERGGDQESPSGLELHPQEGIMSPEEDRVRPLTTCPHAPSRPPSGSTPPPTGLPPPSLPLLGAAVPPTWRGKTLLSPAPSDQVLSQPHQVPHKAWQKCPSDAASAGVRRGPARLGTRSFGPRHTLCYIWEH